MFFETLETLEEIFHYHFLFNRKSPFSKEIEIAYEVGSYDPWLYFTHPSDEDLSFRIHNLEFGQDGQDEAAFLHTSAQRGKEIKFKGFVNRLKFLGFRRIRGYLEVPSEHYKLGIVVNNGRVTELITTKEMHEIPSRLMLTLLSISQNPRKTTLVDKI
ncbi:MAG: hypothetical protein AABW93_00485 [Nanoarchaeota archaeon]